MGAVGSAALGERFGDVGGVAVREVAERGGVRRSIRGVGPEMPDRTGEPSEVANLE
jgi:hypothetical protein